MGKNPYTRVSTSARMRVDLTGPDRWNIATSGEAAAPQTFEASECSSRGQASQESDPETWARFRTRLLAIAPEDVAGSRLV